jgi:hypothetical protein
MITHLVLYVLILGAWFYSALKCSMLKDKIDDLQSQINEHHKLLLPLE